MASGGGGEGGSGPLYHLVQQGLWEAAVAKQEAYTPPTYQQVCGMIVRALSSEQARTPNASTDGLG